MQGKQPTKEEPKVEEVTEIPQEQPKRPKLTAPPEAFKSPAFRRYMERINANRE